MENKEENPYQSPQEEPDPPRSRRIKVGFEPLDRRDFLHASFAAVAVAGGVVFQVGNARIEQIKKKKDPNDLPPEATKKVLKTAAGGTALAAAALLGSHVTLKSGRSEKDNTDNKGRGK